VKGRSKTGTFLDEATVTMILARHFPMAMPADLIDAARDVVLLELLVDDRVPVWEDRLHDRVRPLATLARALFRRATLYFQSIATGGGAAPFDLDPSSSCRTRDDCRFFGAAQPPRSASDADLPC